MILQEFDRPPSALRYMTLAFWPSPGLRPGAPFPSIVMRWRGYRATARDIDRFCSSSGVPASEDLPFLFPHVIGFRLQMALLTHPAFPVPIWRMLQIRNHLRQHRAIGRNAVLELEASVAGHRVLEKGLEVDVHCGVREAGELAWEGTNTFYARGSFGAPGNASPLASAPTVNGDEAGRWRTSPDGALRFGALTGDYNGIHLSDPYARLFGFKRAFLHPQRVLAQCLARLSAAPAAHPRRLDAWLKGPVPYAVEASLRTSRAGTDEVLFALTTDQDERPAIIGRLTCA
ncbi:MAG: acyl dehydratase [Betaproteobacteria bacterium]|nr:acyl dehydratase [Betaproteobacteria bacterium]